MVVVERDQAPGRRARKLGLRDMTWNHANYASTRAEMFLKCPRITPFRDTQFASTASPHRERFGAKVDPPGSVFRGRRPAPLRPDSERGIIDQQTDRWPSTQALASAHMAAARSG